MTRQTSKGTCTFCHGEFSKSAMVRHLETCGQRAITEAKAGSHQKVQKTRKFHLWWRDATFRCTGCIWKLQPA